MAVNTDGPTEYLGIDKGLKIGRSRGSGCN